jgi:hypothetical protein
MGRSRLSKQGPSSRESAPESGLGRGWLEKGLGQALLIGQRQTEDLGFLERLPGCVVSGCNHEVAQGAPLNLRRTLEQRVYLPGQPSFQTGRRGGLNR